MKTLIDFWSIPHFLSGAVAALFAIVFALPVPLVFFLTFAFAVFWEFLEMGFRLREASWNVASDIVLPLISFPMTILLIGAADPDEEHLAGLFLVVLVLYVYTNVVAWHARLNGDPDFMS
jgi:hypothetical protein